MATPAYYLSEDTFACLADNRLVFSDLRSDKYRCLNLSNTQAALRLLPGFRQSDATKKTSEETPPVTDEQTRRVMEALVRKGLLAHETTTGKPVAPVCLPAPTSAFPVDHSGTSAVSHIGHWAAFLQASLRASGKLRLRSLRRTVRVVEQRRLRCFDPSKQDYDTMLALVAIFHHLRPLYTRAYVCRFDSLALIEFLAHYRQFPKWVFGVKAEPFGAHCWVQENDCILNDSVDNVSQFTPIMAF